MLRGIFVRPALLFPRDGCKMITENISRDCGYVQIVLKPPGCVRAVCCLITDIGKRIIKDRRGKMHCNGCNSQLPNDSDFCQFCGKRIDDKEEQLKCVSENPGFRSKWDVVCFVSNILLSILYMTLSWLFSFLGLMFFNLGFPDDVLRSSLGMLSSLMLLLTPVFCILAIVFSYLLRKKENYIASFLIQFCPFGTLGAAVVLFLVSNWM